ncbi:MAG: transporter substrate-binding domain-containing protein [Pseudomonadota bacterium]
MQIAVEGYYPPFSEFNSKGELEGFDIDFAHAVCATLGRECRLVQQDWDELISGEGLQSGSYDAIIASMSILPSRRAKFAFTEKYYTTPARFVGSADAGYEIGFSNGSWSGVEGLRIGVQESTTEDSFLSDHPVRLGLVTRFKTLPEALTKLKSGELDLVFADGFALENGFLSRSEGQGFEMIGQSFDHPRWFGDGIGIAVHRTNWELVNDLNRAIQTIRTNGQYDQIAKKYFNFDIYGTE